MAATRPRQVSASQALKKTPPPAGWKSIRRGACLGLSGWMYRYTEFTTSSTRLAAGAVELWLGRRVERLGWPAVPARPLAQEALDRCPDPEPAGSGCQGRGRKAVELGDLVRALLGPQAGQLLDVQDADQVGERGADQLAVRLLDRRRFHSRDRPGHVQQLQGLAHRSERVVRVDLEPGRPAVVLHGESWLPAREPSLHSRRRGGREPPAHPHLHDPCRHRRFLYWPAR